MIQSMTGFAAASAETPRGRLSVELRSVNARFLDLQFRIADELRALEPALRELVAARISRGKLAAAVGERVAAMRRRLAEAAPLVSQSLAAYQAKLAERLREALGSADDDRVRAELAVFVAKVDVDEELTRLSAHFAEVERTLAEGGARSSAV